MRNLASVSAVKCFPSWAEACFFQKWQENSTERMEDESNRNKGLFSKRRGRDERDGNYRWQAYGNRFEPEAPWGAAVVDLGEVVVQWC